MRIVPDIPIKLEGGFPSNYQNSIQYWGFFSQEKIEKNKGKLLMLDIDFGRKCSLNCPTCFRRRNIVDDSGHDDLTYAQLLTVIDEAKELGLQSVKICGAGEPTEGSSFLQFVRDMTDRGIGVATFTKGHILGSDTEVERIYSGQYGIRTAEDLCKELSRLKVSFMLSFQSFHSEVQDKIVGVRGHTLARNQALINLVNAGFTDPTPTRLSLCNAPVTQLTYPEVFDIYTYAMQGNLLPVIAVSMVSGKQINRSFLDAVDISDQQKLDLWVEIYSWNIKHKIQTLVQIEEEGVSVMPGIHPCNQIACGLYLTANGNVVGCPGFTEIEGNVQQESIKAIWERSKNKMRAGTFNCKCPPKDGMTIPTDLYDGVLKILRSRFGS